VSRPTRIVDAHVHLWDPARTDWYPYLSGAQDIGMETAGMARRFDVPTYRAEAQGWNVEALVNVAAATGRHSIDETLELDRRAADDADAGGHPDAIVGGLPPTGSAAEAIALLERQMAAPRFRGVRPMGASEGPLPSPEVLRALAERDLLFELMAHPDQLEAAARGLEGHGALSVVVEHTGWPRSADDGERRLWADGLRALADLGPHVVCKLSGLAMPLGSMDPQVLAPWLEHAIEAFGPERCMFASNFPVDGMHGTLHELWTAYDVVTQGLSEGDRELLFAGTASRTYRL
jgi:predicted TIM-barrel fold metal-dependent hydrolase